MSVASKGPDFLVIGAQRAGTTWLHRVLRQHPALWLPPVKELHYFDRLDIKRTILSPKERRRVGLKRLASLDPWLISYWFRKRDDDWYASLFRGAQARGLITGEITPAYATLGEELLRRIHRLNEKMKLVFVMRDPVDRVWSAVNNAAKKGVGDASTVEKSIERARESGAVARSAYADTIKRLEAVFPASQIHYCFFDDLRDRPKALTSDVLTFLGVEPVPLQLPKAVNIAAGSKPIPLEFSREMAGDYLSMVQQLCRRFQGPPHKWRARYENLLGGVQAGAPTAAAGTK
jgi:hypothetical protein